MQDNKFYDFRKLYRSVSVLVKASGYIDEASRDCIKALESLARKMEVSNYIQQRNIIAVAGMQGSGKTSLINAIYDLPDGILPAGSERGERIPVFITECEELNDGEYKAREVFFDFGDKYVDEIDVSEISRKCRRGGNTAYIELFVPAKIFSCDNAGFVLLPGFEKNSRRGFDDKYNSIIDYTLHFSNAVILATDSAGIANEEINTITELLGENFNPSNCIFAVTKGDTATLKEQDETKATLLDVCCECGLNVSSDRVISTGIYQSKEKNEAWMEKLFDAVNRDGLLDYEATKRSYMYYKPMVDEMLACADELEKALSVKKALADESPIYDDLKKSLKEMENYFGKELEAVCSEVKGIAKRNLADKSRDDKNLKKHLKVKRFLVLKKSYAQELDDKEAIAAVCRDCLLSDDGSALFIKKSFERLSDDTNRKMLADKFDCVVNYLPDNEEKAEENDKLMNEYICHHLVSRDCSLPAFPDGKTPDTKAVSEAISAAMYASFCNALREPVELESVEFKTDGIAEAINTAEEIKVKGGNAAAAIGVLDLVDGKADIVNSIVSLFTKSAEGAASAASTVTGIVSAAVIVAFAAKKAVNIYNVDVERRKILLNAWEHSLMNAVDEQKNNCQDIFHDACEKLLEHVQKIHRQRNHIGETQQRIANAKYAIADVRYLADKINDQYADKLAEKYGE